MTTKDEYRYDPDVHKIADGLYSANLYSDPDAKTPSSTLGPMSLDKLSRTLVDLGFHPTDIADAFIAADPDCKAAFGVLD